MTCLPRHGIQVAIFALFAVSVLIGCDARYRAELQSTSYHCFEATQSPDDESKILILRGCPLAEKYANAGPLRVAVLLQNLGSEPADSVILLPQFSFSWPLSATVVGPSGDTIRHMTHILSAINEDLVTLHAGDVIGRVLDLRCVVKVPRRPGGEWVCGSLFDSSRLGEYSVTFHFTVLCLSGLCGPQLPHRFDLMSPPVSIVVADEEL